MTNAVVYARYSSYNQQEQSIDGQLRACRDYAAKHGLKIIHEYCDRAKSGTNSNRPEFQKMLHDAMFGNFRIVLVYQFDRFARNRRESMNNKYYLKANGVTVVSINERIDEEDSTSVIVEGMFESIAEFYSKDLSLKVKRGMKESIIKRQTLGGHRLFGYTVDENKKIIVDENEAEIVRLIFDLRSKKMTLYEIADYLNARNIAHNGSTFKKASLRKILSNQKYTGRYPNPFNPVEIIRDMYPQIISIETFDEIQETFANHKINSCKSIKNPTTFYLTGKLYSGLDGAVFSGTSGNSKAKKKYGYYKAKVCGSIVRYNQLDLENKIIKAVKEVIDTEEVLDYLAEAIKDEILSSIKSSEEDELIRQRKKYESQVQKIVDSFVEANDIMRRNLNNRITEYEEYINAIDKKLESINKKKDSKMADKNFIKFFLKQFVNKDLEDPKNRKEFFVVFLNTAFISENHIDIYLNYDVSRKITFAEYKNDLSELQRVRFRVTMAEQERLELSHQLPDLRP